jgi:hypothetical protein
MMKWDRGGRSDGVAANAFQPATVSSTPQIFRAIPVGEQGELGRRER